MSSRFRVPFGAVVAVMLAACAATDGGDRGSDAASSPSPSPRARLATGRMLFEHHDERGLPIGTRIYGSGASSIFVFPGEKAPAAVVRRKPDIVVIE